MGCPITIPGQQDAFLAVVDRLFPRQECAGIEIRKIAPPGSPNIAVVYITDLIAAADLERLVLLPLARGAVAGPPDVLMRSGQFPAAQLRLATAGDALASGLLAGLAAVHVDGHPGALLVGSGLPDDPADRFGTGLDSGVATLYRRLRRADLQAERHLRADGRRVAIAWLKSRAAPRTVRAVRLWSLNLAHQSERLPWWQPLVSILRAFAIFRSTPARRGVHACSGAGGTSGAA